MLWGPESKDFFEHVNQKGIFLCQIQTVYRFSHNFTLSHEMTVYKKHTR